MIAVCSDILVRFGLAVVVAYEEGAIFALYLMMLACAVGGTAFSLKGS